MSWRAEREPPSPDSQIQPLNLPLPLTIEADAQGLPRGLAGRRVEGLQDIWRIDDEWWRTTISRRYFRLRLEGGVIRTVFQDLQTGAWYSQPYS
jgi:hypothetical protein